MKSLLLATLTLTLISPTHAKTIKRDLGGEIILYALAAKQTPTVRFAGQCDSACTLYLQVPDKCITPRASFGFHLPYGGSKQNNAFAADYLRNHYPQWVRRWLRAQGGLTDEIKRLPYTVARRHIPRCPD